MVSTRVSEWLLPKTTPPPNRSDSQIVRALPELRFFRDMMMWIPAPNRTRSSEGGDSAALICLKFGEQLAAEIELFIFFSERVENGRKSVDGVSSGRSKWGRRCRVFSWSQADSKKWRNFWFGWNQFTVIQLVILGKLPTFVRLYVKRKKLWVLMFSLCIRAWEWSMYPTHGKEEMIYKLNELF